MNKMDFIGEAIRLVDEAEKKGIKLRIMGAIAVRIHCPNFSHLLSQLKREITDIDFMSYSKERRKITKFLEKSGYKLNKAIATVHGRYIFEHNSGKLKVDVFFDKLEMCHTINFADRLEVDYPTIPLADLLLEKMQIIQLNEKDIKDTVVLLREHKVGDSEKECINAGYIAKLLSRDWGFYYTVTTNLKWIKEKFIPRYGVLGEEGKKDVTSKIDALTDRVEKHEKSISWKLRAKIGNKKKWYRDVEEAF